MQVQVIMVPYDSGHREARMGRGPGHLVRRGLPERLETAGHDVAVESVEAGEGFALEVKTSFEVYRLLAERVRAARGEGKFPLVLAGNCGSCMGTVSGVGADGTGVVWLDAHGDFNTPETTRSEFLDGMALAALVGRCWGQLAAAIPGFLAVPEENVVQVGVRDLDPEEKKLLQGSGVASVSLALIAQAGVRGALEPALDALGLRVRRVYLHLDLDVLDPPEAVANEFSPPGGLTVGQVAEAIALVRERFVVAACAVTAYDPAYDEGDRAAHAAARLVEAVLNRAGN
jgi:arginase